MSTKINAFIENLVNEAAATFNARRLQKVEKITEGYLNYVKQNVLEVYEKLEDQRKMGGMSAQQLKQLCKGQSQDISLQLIQITMGTMDYPDSVEEYERPMHQCQLLALKYLADRYPDYIGAVDADVIKLVDFIQAKLGPLQNSNGEVIKTRIGQIAEALLLTDNQILKAKFQALNKISRIRWLCDHYKVDYHRAMYNGICAPKTAKNWDLSTF